MNPALTKTMRHIDSFIERICTFFYNLCGIGIFFMMAITCIDVGMRFFAQSPLGGSIELTELTMFLILFFGLGKIQLSESHIAVDLLTDKLSPRAGERVFMFVSLLTALLAVLMSRYLFLSFLDKMQSGEYTPALFLKLSVFIVFGLAGALVFTLAALRNIVTHIGKMKSLGISMFPSFLAAVLVAMLPLLLHDTEFSYDYAKVGFFSIALLITLILLRVSIAGAMCITGIVGLMIISLTPEQGLNVLLSMPASTMNYSVIPMFVLMGEFVLHAKIGEALFASCSLWLGHYPGGLAIAGLSGCAGFSAICGDSLATALTMTSVALPEMKRYRYNSAFSSACLAAGGTLQLPFMLADMVTEMHANRYVVLACIVLMYIGLGCLFNVVPMILLTLPAIFPTVQACGFDPIWFGVITVLLMEMGQITPPVGIIVFAISGMEGAAPMNLIFRHVMPYILCILICVVIMTIFPEIVLYLPEKLM